MGESYPLEDSWSSRIWLVEPEEDLAQLYPRRVIGHSRNRVSPGQALLSSRKETSQKRRMKDWTWAVIVPSRHSSYRFMATILWYEWRGSGTRRRWWNTARLLTSDTAWATWKAGHCIEKEDQTRGRDRSQSCLVGIRAKTTRVSPSSGWTACVSCHTIAI